MSFPSFSNYKSSEFCDAAKRGDLELVKSLSLDYEVNLHWKNRRGWTALINACYYGHVAIVRYLLDVKQREIDYNLGGKFGDTPLLWACNNGHEKVVEMLVDDQRVDLNRTNKYKQTPLYHASRNGRVGVVKIMLASTRQIDTLKKSSHEKTAADIAREQEYFDIVSMIESYQQDPDVKRKLRRELGVRKAGELFALVVFLSDGYLIFPGINGDKNEQRRKNAQRFFNLASSLPLDLQMVLCNRVFGLGDSVVKKIYSEQGFKKLAKNFPQKLTPEIIEKEKAKRGLWSKLFGKSRE